MAHSPPSSPLFYHPDDYDDGRDERYYGAIVGREAAGNNSITHHDPSSPYITTSKVKTTTRTTSILNRGERRSMTTQERAALQYIPRTSRFEDRKPDYLLQRNEHPSPFTPPTQRSNYPHGYGEDGAKTYEYNASNYRSPGSSANIFHSPSSYQQSSHHYSIHKTPTKATMPTFEDEAGAAPKSSSKKLQETYDRLSQQNYQENRNRMSISRLMHSSDVQSEAEDHVYKPMEFDSQASDVIANFSSNSLLTPIKMQKSPKREPKAYSFDDLMTLDSGTSDIDLTPAKGVDGGNVSGKLLQLSSSPTTSQSDNHTPQRNGSSLLRKELGIPSSPLSAQLERSKSRFKKSIQNFYNENSPPRPKPSPQAATEQAPNSSKSQQDGGSWKRAHDKKPDFSALVKVGNKLGQEIVDKIDKRSTPSLFSPLSQDSSSLGKDHRKSKFGRLVRLQRFALRVLWAFFVILLIVSVDLLIQAVVSRQQAGIPLIDWEWIDYAQESVFSSVMAYVEKLSGWNPLNNAKESFGAVPH